MQYFIFVLIICFFISLLTLHITTREDFLFFRKNVSMERLFNIAFIVSVVSILFARFFYVAFHFNPKFFNPLVFLVIPYFPGLSFAGGICGAIVFIVLYGRQKKIPVARIIDYFTFSVLCAMPFGYLGKLLITGKSLFSLQIIQVLLYAILAISFILFFLPRQKRNELQDGTLGSMFLLSFAVFNFIAEIFDKGDKIIFFLSMEGLLSVPIFVLSLIFLLKQDTFAKVRKLKR